MQTEIILFNNLSPARNHTMYAKHTSIILFNNLSPARNHTKYAKHTSIILFNNLSPARNHTAGKALGHSRSLAAREKQCWKMPKQSYVALSIVHIDRNSKYNCDSSRSNREARYLTPTSINVKLTYGSRFLVFVCCRRAARRSFFSSRFNYFSDALEIQF